MTLYTEQTLFENSFSPDKKFAIEASNCVFPKGVKIFSYTFFFLIIIVGLLAIIGGANINATLIIFLAVPIFGLFCPTIRIHYEAFRLIKRFNAIKLEEDSKYETKFLT